jgi:TRAP-type C4-dicarboxylate transport system substrate-binding protein
MKRRMSLSQVVLVSLFAGALLLAALTHGTNASAGDKKVYRFKLANFYPPLSSFNSAVWPLWIKNLEKASNGRIKIKVFPAEQLAKSEDMYEAVESGICDMAHFFLMFEAGRFPVSEYGYLPMIFTSNRTCGMTMTALYEKYPQIRNEFKNVKVLWFNGNAPAQFFTRDQPIKTLDDLKGLKINGGGLYWKHVAERLGFAPMSLPFPEIYDALAKGVIDGNTVEWEGQYIFRWYELDKCSMGGVNLYIYPFIMCMNKKKWDSLPPDIQKIFNDFSGVKGAEMTGYIFDQHDLAAKKKIEEYVKKKGLPPVQFMSEEKRDELKARLQPVIDLWLAEMKKKGVPGEQILKDAEAMVKELDSGPDLNYWKREELIKKTKF